MYKFYCNIQLLLSLCIASHSAPLISNTGWDSSLRFKQEIYLRQFGYIKTPYSADWGTPGVSQDLGAAGAIITNEAFREAVRAFQRMAGLPETGEMDERTQEMMSMPRCGVPDITSDQGLKKRRRKKRYVASGYRWPTTSISYNIGSYVREELNFPKDAVISEIRKSFKFWSDVSALTFIELNSSNADILLNFVPRDHGDGYPLDGPGGVLAHTFYPTNGDVHFDREEAWTTNTYAGTNLLYVSTHELGHSLGLAHSNSGSSIMAPFYRAYNPNLQLTQDDIDAIQFIYGRPQPPTTTTKTTPPTTTKLTPPPATTTTATTTTTTMTTTTITRIPPTSSATSTTAKSSSSSTWPRVDSVFPRPRAADEPRQFPPEDWCKDSSINAVTNIRGVAYFFKGDRYAAVDDYGIIPGYPKYIRETWPEVPSNVDAVLYWEDLDELYFLKEDLVWRYNGRIKLDPWYPKSVWSKFIGLPGYIDAAFVFGGDNTTYFIKGDQYYRYNRQLDGVEQGYPQSTGIWNGLPSRIDSAFQWTNRETYFFSGRSYYRFDSELFQTDHGYPRPTAVLWFYCDDQYST